VIAPEADVKLFVTAAPEVRAQRRVRELLERGMPAHYDDVLLDLRARDLRDMSRDASPLAQAPDAITLDTSELTIEEAIEMAMRLVEEKLEVSGPRE
jgi:cytidylate kinase